MSIVQVKVELPTYAHSFYVNLPSESNVLHLKQEISKSCAGAPRVDGQRIIWRGRYLSDSETLQSLWKSPEEPRIVHLSVHPSAWTANPPTHHKEFLSQPAPLHIPSPTPTIPSASQASPSQPVTPQPSQSSNPRAYVVAKHQKALSILMQRPISADDGSQSDEARQLAMQFLERHGYIWPTILDQPFPPLEAGGLRYEVTAINGQRYLNLQNPTAKPTSAQLHALNVLSYTLALLKLPAQVPTPTQTAHSQPVELPPHINALLQQMGLPLPNAVPNQQPIAEVNQANVVIEAREIQLRPLILPLIMLTLRTVLLLYFVAPARKPVFGILILAWVLYEIWRPIRNALVRLQRAVPADQQDQQNGGVGAAAGADQAQEANPAQPNAGVPGPQPPVPVPAADMMNAAAVLDTLANYDIQEEESALANGGSEPSLGRKAVAFITLLFSTVHPAIWNRRRALLRRREGRIRTEANAMEAQDQGEDEAQNTRRAETRRELLAQHARRPRWIQNYIGRVVREDWIDDSD